LRGEHGVVGILEIFSDKPYAFTDAHITLLKQLAQIAVTGRSKSISATLPSLKTTADTVPVAEPILPKILRPFPFQTLAARMKGEEGQPYRMAAAGAVLLALIVGFGWMISRVRSGNSNNHAPRSVQAASPARNTMAATPDTTLTITPSTTAERGGQELLKLGIAKPRASRDAIAGDVVQRASSEVVTSRNSSKAADATKAAPNGISPVPPGSEEVQAPGLDTLASSESGAPSLPSLGSEPHLPTNSLRTSQGITGGALTHRVNPIYPTQARIQRIEGTVVLEALVGEDGNVHNVKVSSGSAVLASAAKQAVEQWRYQPFQLNGKPVSMSTSVKIVFKLP
jgi:TonB family protein